MAAKRSWWVFTGIVAVLGFLGIVNRTLQQQLVNIPSWTLILLLCILVVYTVIAAAYEESKDRTDSEKTEVERGMVKAVTTSADAAKESAIAYKSGQSMIDGLQADLKEANDKLTQCMEKNAALREEIAGLKSRDDG